MFLKCTAVPEPIFLKWKELGEILFALDVEFKTDLSNVLTIVTKLILQNNTATAAKINYDLDFLVRLS